MTNNKNTDYKLFCFLNEEFKNFKITKDFDGSIPIKKKDFLSVIGMDQKNIDFNVIGEYMKVLLSFKVLENYKDTDSNIKIGFDLTNLFSKIVWNKNDENCLFFVPTVNHLGYAEYKFGKIIEAIE